jgi:ubiquinone/menaquinone biosynthesis C-methylase UbiE
MRKSGHLHKCKSKNLVDDGATIYICLHNFARMPDHPFFFAGSIPENYDRYLGPYIFEPYAEELVSRVAGASADIPGSSGSLTILETACGTGRVTIHLKKAFPVARLVATDFNPDMVTLAKKRAGHEDIEWKTADAQALPFEDEYFDMVVFQFGLMFVPDKQLALREAFRVLKRGGHFFFSTWNKLDANPSFDFADQLASRYFPNEPPKFFYVPFALYDEMQLVAWTKEAGFSKVEADLVLKVCQSGSSDDVAAGMLEGTPMFTAINERDPSLLPAMKAELSKELAAEFGAAPLVSPMQAWLFEATK